MTGPRYEHNCRKCEFLGYICGHDIYRCSRHKQQEKPTLVARKADAANEPDAYESGGNLFIPGLRLTLARPFDDATERARATAPLLAEFSLNQMTEQQRDTFYRENKCPFCRTQDFRLGPRGGLCQNLTCVNCNAKLNVDPVGLVAEILKAPDE